MVIDEAGGATKQVTEYRNLVERSDVDFVIGHMSSGDCLAVAPVAEELKKLTVLFDCGTPRVFEEASYKYVFRARPHATMDAVAAALYLLEVRPDVKTYAGINQNYAWGQDSWSDFSAAMSALKPDAKVTTSQMPKFGAGEYELRLAQRQDEHEPGQRSPSRRGDGIRSDHAGEWPSHGHQHPTLPGGSGASAGEDVQRGLDQGRHEAGQVTRHRVITPVSAVYSAGRGHRRPEA